MLYVANVSDEGSAEVPQELAAHAAGGNARAVAVAARIEEELAELDPEEADAMRSELGAPPNGVQEIVRVAFELLRLLSFFTANRGSEARAHAVRRGTTALEAAREVHTDMQHGFVRAEVIAWDALVEAGGYGPARDQALLRLEGRDYEVADGDVVTIRFTG